MKQFKPFLLLLLFSILTFAQDSDNHPEDTKSFYTIGIPIELNTTEQIVFELKMEPEYWHVGSFNSKDNDRYFYISRMQERGEVMPGEFVMIRNSETLYIINIQTMKVIGTLDCSGVTSEIKIAADESGHAKIIYWVTGMPSEGDEVFMPGAPTEYELIFRNGKYIQR